jgi:cell pole-organizing protein PopZ
MRYLVESPFEGAIRRGVVTALTRCAVMTGVRCMAQPAKAQEPSMEEILASIRRIIADDDAAKPQPPKAPEPPAKPDATPKMVPPPRAVSVPPPAAKDLPAMGQDEIDVMLAAADADDDKLDDDVEPDPPDVLDLTEDMAAAPPPPKPPTNFHRIEADQDVVFREAARPSARPATPPPSLNAHSDPPLLSASATAAVNSAFGTLAHSMLVQNAKTLEDLVKEMLRPMLKTWLDDNLPILVERLVRAEIERVSRGHAG